MLLGTAAAGIGTSTTIITQFVPQYLYWNNGTTPQSISVSVQNDGVITSLSTNGINNFAALRFPGRATNGFYIPLSNGNIPGKIMTITFVNNVAAPINIYGISLQNGNTYVQCLQQQVLANSGTRFEKFAFLGLPAVAAGDIINITYKDGYIHDATNVELASMQAIYQNNVNGTTIAGVDNFAGNVSNVRFTPAADQTVFLLRYISVGSALAQTVNMG